MNVTNAFIKLYFGYFLTTLLIGNYTLVEKVFYSLLLKLFSNLIFGEFSIFLNTIKSRYFLESCLLYLDFYLSFEINFFAYTIAYYRYLDFLKFLIHMNEFRNLFFSIKKEIFKNGYSFPPKYFSKPQSPL